MLSCEVYSKVLPDLQDVNKGVDYSVEDLLIVGHLGKTPIFQGIVVTLVDTYLQRDSVSPW